MGVMSAWKTFTPQQPLDAKRKCKDVWSREGGEGSEGFKML
jgi:hypothetical protein